MSTAPSQMFENYAEIYRGSFKTDRGQLQYIAELSDNVTVTMPAGRILHLNDSGEFETGLPSSKDIVMPILMWSGSTDWDVTNYGGDVTSDTHVWVPVGPTGNMMGFPVISGYEFLSTEYEPAATAGTYSPNTALTATYANTNATTGGRITQGTPYTDHLCGIVSQGEITGRNSTTALAFWGYVLPSTP